MPTGLEEISLFGGLIILGPVTLIIIAEAIFIFFLMNADAFITRAMGSTGISFSRFFLLWVFFIFAFFSATPALFGIDAQDLALIVSTLILFGIFIPGFGISNIRRNAIILVVAILGSIVGYQIAIMILGR